MIIFRGIFIILLTTLLLSCSEYPENTEVLRVNSNALKSQSSIKNTPVSISPVDATVQSIITLRADNSIISDGEIHWYINGNRDKSLKGLRFTPDELNKGDVVQSIVINDNKEFHSNEIVIKNTPPSILKAGLLPVKPKISSTIRVDVKANDVDNDNISFKYKWNLNGKFAGEESYLETDIKRGDTIVVEVTPYDDEASGKSIRIKGKVYNSLPVFSESTPAFDGKVYKYQVIATDPDKDTLTFKLEEGPEGMSIDPTSGVITWETGSKDVGFHYIKVLISDNKGGKILVPFTTRISFAEKQ